MQSPHSMCLVNAAGLCARFRCACQPHLAEVEQSSWPGTALLAPAGSGSTAAATATRLWLGAVPSCWLCAAKLAMSCCKETLGACMPSKQVLTCLIVVIFSWFTFSCDSYCLPARRHSCHVNTPSIVTGTFNGRSSQAACSCCDATCIQTVELTLHALLHA